MEKQLKERLISFETAKLAKEKGFDEEVLNHYSQEDCAGKQYNEFQDDIKNSEAEHFEYSAPTQSLLQKWLREKHGIKLWMSPVGEEGELYHIEDITKNNLSLWGDLNSYETYEEALEVGLQEALKLIEP